MPSPRTNNETREEFDLWLHQDHPDVAAMVTRWIEEPTVEADEFSEPHPAEPTVAWKVGDLLDVVSGDDGLIDEVFWPDFKVGA